MMRKNRTYPYSVICILCVAIVALYLPSRVFAELPPRPTRPITPNAQQPTPELPSGTLILNTQPSVSGAWSVVQWQDATGTWQDVEGWRGEVSAGKTIWWVEQAQWHSGPFRWAIFEAPDGKLLATSTLFALPGSGEKSVIYVNLTKL